MTFFDKAIFGVIAVAIALVTSSIVYSSHLKHDCKIKAMEKSMKTEDIKTVCGAH